MENSFVRNIKCHSQRSVWNDNQTHNFTNTYEVESETWEIDERNLKIIFESNLLSTYKKKKCRKQQQPAQHQICRQDIRHQKFLSKHQKRYHWNDSSQSERLKVKICPLSHDLLHCTGWFTWQEVHGVFLSCISCFHLKCIDQLSKPHKTFQYNYIWVSKKKNWKNVTFLFWNFQIFAFNSHACVQVFARVEKSSHDDRVQDSSQQHFNS